MPASPMVSAQDPRAVTIYSGAMSPGFLGKSCSQEIGNLVESLHADQGLLRNLLDSLSLSEGERRISQRLPETQVTCGMRP